MKFFVAVALLVVVGAEDYFRLRSPFSYNCQNGLCVKELDSEAPTYTSLQTCQLTCGKYGALFPEPTGDVRMTPETVSFSPLNIRFTKKATSDRRVARMLDNAIQHFTRNIHFLHPDYPEDQKTPLTVREFEQLMRFEEQQYGNSDQQQYRQRSEIEQPLNRPRPVSDNQRFNRDERRTYVDYSPFFRSRSSPGAERQRLNIEVTITATDTKLSLDTNESYNLVVQTVGDETTATILATTYYGARHALETLSQLIAYDDVSGAVQIIREANIQDEPSFKYRGFMLDTGRNFYPKEDLMRLLDAMSYNKLNYFHWHINDAASFPMYSTRLPKFTYYGAYDARKVYYPEDIKAIVEYANHRGITVIPEIGGPAHNAAGWQFAQGESTGELALCTNLNQDLAWFDLSKEAPPGQLNPINPEVYEVLGELYRDVMDYFAPDIVHMGGDDVSFKCWQNSQEIKQYFIDNRKSEPSSRDYFDLWNTYQTNAYTELQNAAQGRKVTPIISSSSFALNYLDKDSYILQVIEDVNDNALDQYVQKGFRIILSNQDQWNLDSARPSKGRDDPTRYPTWEDFYRNSPLDVLKLRQPYEAQKQFTTGFEQTRQTNAKGQVLGGEATLHSFETDGNGLQPKAFPRVSAFAERLWTDPTDDRNLEDGTVRRRLNVHRQRLVYRGIQADAIQPEYCTQNAKDCYSREQYLARTPGVN